MDDLTMQTPGEIMVCSLLVKRMYEHFMHTILNASDLPRIEIEILLFLANNPHLNTAASIVTQKGYTKSHVSTALKHLEAEGYITKKHPANNRKTYCLHLEDKAYPLVARGREYQKQFTDALCKGIPEEDLQKTWSTLTAMAKNAWETVSEN